MNSEQKRIIVAVLLSGLVLFGWQTFFAPPIPVNQTTSAPKPDAIIEEETVNSKDTNIVSVKSKDRNIISTTSQENLSEVILTNGEVSYVVGNSLTINDSKNPNQLFDFKNIVGEKQRPLQVKIIMDGNSIPVFFNLRKTTEKSLIGTNEQYGISLKANLLDNGKLDLNLNSKIGYRYQFVLRSEPKELENRQIRQFITLTKDVERTNVGEDDTSDGSIKWFGVDFNFHLFSVIFKEKVLSRFALSTNSELVLDTVNTYNNLDLSFVFTLKNYDHLKKLGHNLDLSVDFGIFGIVAVPILRGLQFFYNYIPNYGFSIIILTLFIRLLMFPLQYKSSKSMKKMQKIQPQMKKIREKFKENPQKMQQETMALMKSAGANPVGGCLPIILQMPILFAFYQVLYSAVELVGAPFTLWITDLSVKDPYYVLPVLMGIAMYFQTKVTPQTTADPTQQKVMAFMPLIFCFFMKDLPAGLNLYIFISTVFGVIQTLVVYKYTD